MTNANLCLRVAHLVFAAAVVDVAGCGAPRQAAPPCLEFAGDTDGDGVCDAIDNCVGDVNTDQADSDGDGIGDACDAGGAICVGQGGDDDDDNVCGIFDNCPNDANTDQADVDDNGVGDACDDDVCDGIDNDANGIIDDGASDEDGDGVADCVDVCTGRPDVDTDQDGVPDCADACPRDRNDDRDGDGLCADVDNCPELSNPAFSFPGQADSDGDGIGDACDVEECDGVDNDGDGQVDEGFPDADDDSVCDDADPCPGDQVNDEDGDGLCGSVDNCPTVANADQADADDDGVGDACDLDADGLCDDAAPLVDVALPPGLEIRGLAGDALSDLVYVATAGTSSALPNRVVAIDGATCRVTWSVLVGSDPTRLALSDDGRALYVGVDGSGSVRLVDTTRRRACGSFSVAGERSSFGPLRAGDIATVPGRPQTVLVSAAYTGLSPDYAGTYVYDAGQPRPVGTNGHTGARLVAAVSETEAYGFNSLTTEFGFRRLRIDARGVHEEDVVAGLIEGFQIDRIVHAGDRVYGGNASVNFTTMRRAGTFAASGPVAVDAGAAEVFFVEGSAVRVFDAERFLFLRTLPLPNTVGGSFGFGPSIVRFGERGIAVADADQIVCIDGAVSG